MTLFKTIKFIINHPLNAHRKIEALWGFLRWQFGSRLLPGSVAINFVDSSRLLVRPHMTGATGNIYTGLHEFEDMAFTLHLLRKDDVFVDIGANVGSYTVLAGAVVGAKCFAFEPVPATFEHLLDNIYLNRIEERVTALRVGIGARDGVLNFTSGFDTRNHVFMGSSIGTEHIIEIPVKRLDNILKGKMPTLIKIDVEGFETAVVEGAEEILLSPSLLAVIMELSNGKYYDYDGDDLHRSMVENFKFEPFHYSPIERKLTSLGPGIVEHTNILYLRNIGEVKRRIKSAPKFSVNERQI